MVRRVKFVKEMCIRDRSSLRPLVCTCRISMLFFMFMYVRFAKVDSVVECSDFVCSVSLFEAMSLFQVQVCTSVERERDIDYNDSCYQHNGELHSIHIDFPEMYFKERISVMIGAAKPAGWLNEEMFLRFLKHFNAHVKCSKYFC